jgi:DNA-binding SARP family transcriptional activator/tetratricopeptide (TPR) repeat protein
MSGGRAEMLRVSLLGEQVLTDDVTGLGRTRSSRTLALLTFLVVHAGAPQARGRIAALFWPDSTDEQALTNLRRELHHLRSALGSEASLVVTSKDLCWRDTATCRVDVRVFDVERRAALAAALAGDSGEVLARATAAVGQYRGELAPGGVDDWLLDARSELEQRCVDLFDLIRETRARTGDLTGAVDAARRRIALRPLEEAGYQRLMELQGDLGDRASAVSTYHHCASVLERELGVEPDPATRGSLNRLLARVGPPSAPVAPAQPAAGRSGLAAARLVGRVAEFAVLAARWRTAAAGSPSLVLVRGDAGVGKTRLVAEVADVARRHGAVVASTRCFGTAGRLALSPVADWLRTPAVQAGMAALDPVWQVEVQRLVPSGKGTAFPGAPGAPEAPSRAVVDAWQQHRFFEGMARALIGVGRPMLLVLDNLQWCDQETLAFLTFCLGLTTDAPVMVAATLRDDYHLRDDDQSRDDGHEPGLAAWIARIRATGMLTDIALGPLEVSDTARLATAISGRSLTGNDANLLQATTGGFPLYVVEAARGTVDPGSSPLPVGDLMAVLRNRLEQATSAARDVAGLAAAVGRNFTLDLLTEASDLDADSVVRAVDELWRRRIVREIGDGYDFSHDLLRESAYAQVSPPKRWLLHRRLAQCLELAHAGDPDAVSVQLAEQYARGGRGERAVAYYRRAADVAAGRFAHAEAIRLHKEALSIIRTLPDGRARTRHELAVLEAMAAPLNARYGYASPELRTTLERTMSLAEALADRESMLTGLLGLCYSQFVQGDISAAHRTADRALTLVEPGSELGGPAHFIFGGSAASLGRPAEALRHFELGASRGGAYSLSVGTRPDVHGTAFAAHVHWLLGHDDEAVRSRDAAIALARAARSPYNLAVALAYSGITHQLRGDLAGLRLAVGELRELCDRYGFAYYREWGLVLDGWSRTDASGIELARRGVDNLKADGSFTRMPYWLSLLADLLARNDSPDAARATLDAALVAGQANEDLWWLPEVMRMRAAYDDEQAAVTRLRSAARLASAHDSVALLRRCTDDLAALGVRDVTLGVRRAH